MIGNEIIKVIFSVHPELAASAKSISADQFSQLMRLLASVPEEAPRELAPPVSLYLRESAPAVSPYLMATLQGERL